MRVMGHTAFFRRTTAKRSGRLVTSLIALGALAGCSGIRTYPGNSQKNLRVTVEEHTGSMFSNVKVSMDVFKLKGKCVGDYVGTVDLKRGVNEVGLPESKLSYLIFIFKTSHFLEGGGNTNYQTLIGVRRHQFYDAHVRYRNGIYDVTISEGRRELPQIVLPFCKQ